MYAVEVNVLKTLIV